MWGIHLCTLSISGKERNMTQERAHEEGQQHPIKLYLVVWGWLFVLSTCSYLVDYFGLEGYLRWSLILLFMIVKAGLIVAVFMHMAWERLALMYAILVPPGAVLLLVAIMVAESDYTHFTRVSVFGAGGASAQTTQLQSAMTDVTTKPPVIAGAETASPSQPSTNVTAQPPTTTDKPSVLEKNPTSPMTYTVAAGDTFSKIAIKLYGDARKWREIARANPHLNVKKLKAGQIIYLPRIPAKETMERVQ
jgi:cytochrome c oxidase subunit IV/phage tail protein X